MIHLVELGPAIWFEHENHHILPKVFVTLFPLPQEAGTTWYSSPRVDWLKYFDTLILLVVERLKHTFWQKIKRWRTNSDRQMFRKGHCLSLKRLPFVLYLSMFYELIGFFFFFAKTYFLPFRTPILILVCWSCGTFLRVKAHIDHSWRIQRHSVLPGTTIWFLWAHELPLWYCYMY